MCLLSVSPTGLSAFCLFSGPGAQERFSKCLLLGFLGSGQPKPRPGPSTQPPPPSQQPARCHLTSAPLSLATQACLWSLAPLPLAHRCLGRAGDPECPVPHHSPKPLTPGSSPGLNLQGCRRNPILATERRQPPERLPCKRATAMAGRRPGCC